VRKEKAAGYIGLALFSLFPLLGAFQVRDPAEGWRAVASRTRPSILSVQPRGRGAGVASPTGCAVVLSMKPARVVVSGVVSEAGLCTVQDGQEMDWRPAYVDPSHDFTILESEGSLRVAGSPQHDIYWAAGIVPIDPATVGDLESEGRAGEPVNALLVAPAWLEPSPLWIGALRLQRAADGRLCYAGSRLHALPDASERSPGDGGAEAGAALPGVDPVLRGAPFVTMQGVVLGLYVGDLDGHPRAVPMALVREAVSGLDRRAAR